MLAAARVHFKQGEPKAVAANVAILLLCVFVAYGRLTELAQ